MPPGGCRGQGKFETWDLSRLSKGAITPLDTWETELNGMFTSGAVDSKAPVTVNCSSHWFDAKDGVAAVGWYEQGVRFLDYRTPTRDRRRSATTSRRTGRRGRRTGRRPTRTARSSTRPTPTAASTCCGSTAAASAGKKVKAPVRNEWLGSPAADAASFKPHPDFGFVCPVLKAGVHVP